MRVNEPITDREKPVPEGEPLVSRTDPGGRIVFAKHVFVATSGFSIPCDSRASRQERPVSESPPILRPRWTGFAAFARRHGASFSAVTASGSPLSRASRYSPLLSRHSQTYAHRQRRRRCAPSWASSGTSCADDPTCASSGSSMRRIPRSHAAPSTKALSPVSDAAFPSNYCILPRCARPAPCRCDPARHALYHHSL